MNRYLFCFIALLLFIPTARGEAVNTIDSTLIDSSYLKIRHVGNDFFSAYKADNDFQYYATPGEQVHSFWESLIYWLIRHLRLSRDSFNTLNLLMKIFFGILIAGILIYTVSRLELYKYFYTREALTKTNFSIEMPDQDVEDLDQAISRELANKNFRAALRYQFLLVLRELDANGIIVLSTDKTNIDYLQEIRRTRLASAALFETLVRIYNAVWYGHFMVSEADYVRLSVPFDKFKGLVHEEA